MSRSFHWSFVFDVFSQFGFVVMVDHYDHAHSMMRKEISLSDNEFHDR